MYLEENLKLSPENMSDKAVASDELKEMHQQVNICLSKRYPPYYYYFIVKVKTQKRKEKKRRYKMCN
jgi:hypothetical protein